MNYTKGEWKILTHKTGDEVDGLWVQAGDAVIVSKLWLNGWQPKEEVEANAHLIAAAPMMYEALKAISSAKRADARYDGSDARGFILLADKALAKAEGREEC